jgi:hypothetical protein
MAQHRLGWLVIAIALSLAALSTPATASPVTFEGAGAIAADIQAVVDAFRSAVGPLNPNNGSAFGSGRREINWDGVTDALADPNPFPGDFFNSTTVAGRARGAQFATPGTGFLVSADAVNPTGTPVGFGFPSDFHPFSVERLFSPTGSNVTDVTFFVPGTAIAGTVGAFGAVFSDVEVAGSTRLDAFDSNGNLLFGRDVLTVNSGGFSFLGVLFDAGERIGRIRLTSGNSVLIANGQTGPGTDTVVMDDFIYAEPQGVGATAVPEPSAIFLTGNGLLLALAEARRRVWSRTRE